ncbi:single-stranded DNA-binding protein [Bacteroidales bacterium OttesenSCG-928-I21]|nr:single-stranded DNA-binding protein [Bacteroidales bacterium OttesenSCG-928-I21]
MNLRNRAQLIGNLGNNPVVKLFENGNKVARFSLATSEVYKKGNKFVKDTQWHIVVVWGKLADMVERNLKIGSEVVVDGYIAQRSFVDKNGQKQYITEIIANSLLCRSSEKQVIKSMSEVEKRA